MALTKVSTGVVDMSQDTGGLVIAKGNGTDVSSGGERPTCTTAILGSIRENTTDNKVEVCTANSGTPTWQFLEEAGPTFVPLTVDYLVIAGGGAGKNGGGGAGGMREGSETLTSPYSIDLTIGTGGEPVGTVSSTGLTAGFDGEDSIFTISGLSTITSTGGGQGGRTDRATGTVGPGGSGGGGGSASGVLTQGGTGNTPATSPAQGYDGGTNGNYRGSPYPSGGGGGAGAVGGSATSNNQCGAGGAGRQSSITGVSPTPYYAGGGGGGMYSSSSGNGAGGIGGGGDGYRGTNQAIQNGTANTGSGGGGGGNNNNGGYGGDGVVIIKYPSAYTVTKSVGLISSVSTSVAGYKIETFTSGTGTITFA
tara:strand:- start:2037 stop:3131 length:1095 start_codon:yes stop_codon:yes gene_type:complete